MVFFLLFVLICYNFFSRHVVADMNSTPELWLGYRIVKINNV